MAARTGVRCLFGSYIRQFYFTSRLSRTFYLFVPKYASNSVGPVQSHALFNNISCKFRLYIKILRAVYVSRFGTFSINEQPKCTGLCTYQRSCAHIKEVHPFTTYNTMWCVIELFHVPMLYSYCIKFWYIEMK
jgi:hypothetical protein